MLIVKVEDATLSRLEIEVIDLFVNVAGLLGMPRSVGEIYGLLFLAPAPVPMDEIIDRLRISLGSASQGLRLLRSFGAVKTQYVAGERRDHFVVETELRTVMAGFLKEQVYPHLQSGASRLVSLRDALQELPREQRAAVAPRLERLERWQQLAAGMMPAIQEMARG